ncbi:hypothetical protein Psta_0787 [Pirellula staleyi DSM 6068]|uniref:CPXCG motif-containing cysteine-rich protein n=1 Tax=Pirellula staleyi (strain ATCC 27377 / DSM 6068 / ICPB 4128) TaxID=530564 RepID=D2R694_PIRSD|nr:CPXCG motif-containing cysteine-rich protein [Pirellula staleyi]ADB15472.1 hypothetical protein Psta_0787 [Pirellula staleyi DSM 6068]
MIDPEKRKRLLARKRKKLRARRRRERLAQPEASYICDACGEEIVIPIDLSAGTEQQYVEDCPVCCRPNVIYVELGETVDDLRVWAEGE